LNNQHPLPCAEAVLGTKKQTTESESESESESEEVCFYHYLTAGRYWCAPTVGRARTKQGQRSRWDKAEEQEQSSRWNKAAASRALFQAE
jgi:hypothetical protein